MNDLRLVTPECGAILADALSQAKRMVDDAKVHPRLMALFQIASDVEKNNAEVSIESLRDMARELLIEVCRSNTSEHGINEFTMLYHDVIERVTALRVSRAFSHPEMRHEDTLMDEATTMKVKPIHKDDKPIQMFWQSGKMQKAWDRAMSIAQTNSSVLLQAERGSGKELFARSIHANSPRAHRELIVINSTTIPAGIAESALFGHKKGAFTGAGSDKKGVFEVANGSTIFFDEIGNIPLELQNQLLRIAEYGDYRKVGDENGGGFLDIRIVAATNRNLVELVKLGKFLPDLLDRLQFTATIPPLRERSDLEQLADHLLATRYEGRSMSEHCKSRLHMYNWPGNVRELDGALKNAIIDCPNGVIEWENISPYLRYKA